MSSYGMGMDPLAHSCKFSDFEAGGHDGAYKVRVHVILPFVGRKNGTFMA